MFTKFNKKLNLPRLNCLKLKIEANRTKEIYTKRGDLIDNNLTVSPL